MIRPDGSAFEQKYASAQSPSFVPANGALSDGKYTWEVVTSPIVSPEERAKAQSLRDQGLPASLPQGSVESGSFRVLKGNLLLPDSSAVESKTSSATTAKSASADQGPSPEPNVQVINDDLVVLGSQCIGLDCPTAPSFGFDTLRLQENNLRINFADTSSTASFPTADWRIVANDTTNGGASYLAFEDTGAGNQPFRVEAGAGSAALWVTDSGGNVGMGTTTPVVELHITDGDSPTFRLEQNGASGFTPQTWDVAGNEANFFIRDVTNGSQLPFKIQPGAPTDSVFIASNGNVSFGVGTSTPVSALHVKRSGPTALTLHNTVGSATNGWSINHSNANNLVFNSNDTAGPEFEMLATGGVNVSSPGPVAVAVHNTTKTNPWTIAHTNGNNLVFNSNDTAGPEFEILATGGIRVSGAMMNVPDYVFRKDYKLRSVDELESFVQEKGHLPGVTSAKDVAESGSINITEMQMQMLEKIEELTLYTIQQEKRIKELEAQNKK